MSRVGHAVNSAFLEWYHHMATKSAPKPATLPDKLVTIADVARMIGVSTQTVRIWIANGKLPKPFRLGKRFYWQPEKLRDSILRQSGGGAS